MTEHEKVMGADVISACMNEKGDRRGKYAGMHRHVWGCATIGGDAPRESLSRKNDRKDGKPMWELLPLATMEDVVKVYTFGAEKYGCNTWQNLENGYERYKAAMLRHIVEYEKGNAVDDESGLPHLAHAAWNAIAMLHIAKGRPDVDAEQPTNKEDYNQ